MAIKRHEATQFKLWCDACHSAVVVYAPTADVRDLSWPEGWVCYPDLAWLGFDGVGPDPKVVLCPAHGDLIATVALVEKLTADFIRHDPTMKPVPQGVTTTSDPKAAR